MMLIVTVFPFWLSSPLTEKLGKMLSEVSTGVCFVTSIFQLLFWEWQIPIVMVFILKQLFSVVSL